MMLQTMIVKNGLIRINDQYARNPRQTIRIANSKSSSFDALSFGDRSWSSIAAVLSKSRSRTSSQRQILRNWVATKAGSQRQGWCCDPPILLPGLAYPTAHVGVCKIVELFLNTAQQ